MVGGYELLKAGKKLCGWESVCCMEGKEEGEWSAGAYSVYFERAVGK